MASIKNPSDTVYWNDLRNDEKLRACRLDAKGLWLDMLCICGADPKGELRIDGIALDEQMLADAIGKPLAEVKKALENLEQWTVFSRTRKGVIFNRRMKRDKELREKRSKSGKMGAEAKKKKAKKKDGVSPSKYKGKKGLHKQKPSKGVSKQSSKRKAKHSPPRARSSLSSLSSKKFNKKVKQFKSSFPEGSIKHTLLGEIAEQFGGNWDVDLIGKAFRDWPRRDPNMKGEVLLKAFATFCETFVKKKGKAA